MIENKEQFLPNIDELKNKDVVSLSKKLEGKSDKETLNNLLEWQERNILFWTDRWHYRILISIVIIAILSIIGFFQILSIIGFQILKLYPIYQLISLSLLFGALLGYIFYLILKYSKLKSRIQNFKLTDIFRISLPIDKIIGYKLSICRDYAKLTAALLYNLFPNSQIYFITIRGHVAAGIKINEKLYFLDQNLPLLTLDGWLRAWNKKTANIYQMKVLDSNGKKKVELEKCNEEAKIKNTSSRINTKKLTKEVAKIIGIKQVTHEGNTPIEIKFNPQLGKIYEDDKLVIYSIARAIKLKLEKELCSNIDRVEKIQIKYENENPILHVYLKP